jgi:hypothetical protein
LSSWLRGLVKARYAGPSTAAGSNAATRWQFWKSEHDAEVSFQGTADGVAGERAQQLATVAFGGRRYLVLADRPVRGAVGHGGGHHLPGVGQGRADDVDERRVVDRAEFGSAQDRGGDIEGHETSGRWRTVHIPGRTTGAEGCG